MIRPLPSSEKAFPKFADGHSLRSMIMSPSAQVVPISSRKPKLADIDLVNLEAPAQGSTDSSHQEATVVSDAKSLPVYASITEKTTVMACPNYRDSIRGQDSKVVLVEAPCALVEARTDSSRSESSECSTPTRRNEGDGSMTEMINKLIQERNSILQKNDDNFSKTWDEPLLAVHDQEALDLMAKKEAKAEAKGLVAEERLERERQLHELRALAHCTTLSAPSLGRSSTFKKSKLKVILGTTGVTGVYRFLKSPFRIFRSNKKYTEYYPGSREAKVVVPKASLFGGCCTVPSSGSTAAQLAMMRNAPQLGLTRRPHIQFATVESTQRDVPAWTREEYLRKNGRISKNSTYKKEDEEFGGIEGNNLMNQYFQDDGILTDYDSDSD